jgi:Protein of unknown function (DUF2510)/Domain of unknown function (DUF4352)
VSDVLTPGWYEDPWHHPGMRWWDGHQWTTHTVIPHGAPAPPVAPVAPRPAPALRHPPWWVWTLAALALLAPFIAFIALVLGSASRTNRYAYSPREVASPVTAAPTTSYGPPHSLRAGPAPQGRSLRIQTRNGAVRVAVTGVVDPVDRGGYYRGPRSGTRWVGVRLRVVNAGADDYVDDVGNDTRLVAGKKALQADSALLDTCRAFPVQVTLAPGEGREGCVLFEVPTGAQPRQLRFASDSYFGPELGTFILGR